MTTYLGKSCSFCLPRVPFVNCRQFMYLVISLLVLRAGYGIWLYKFLIIAYLFTLQVWQKVFKFVFIVYIEIHFKTVSPTFLWNPCTLMDFTGLVWPCHLLHFVISQSFCTRLPCYKYVCFINTIRLTNISHGSAY